MTSEKPEGEGALFIQPGPGGERGGGRVPSAEGPPSTPGVSATHVLVQGVWLRVEGLGI